MSAPATPLPSQGALLDLSRQLAGIWALLSRGISLWAGRERATPLPLLTYTRAGRLVARLQTLLALLATGRLPRSYPPRPSPAAVAGTSRDDPPPRPRPPSPPRRVGWLMPKAIELRWAASQLQHWLADPTTRAVLEGVPQARRPLAALCRMLAIPPWPHPSDGPLPPPRPRVRKVRPRDPRASAAEERAILWQHRSCETDHGSRTGKRPWWLPPKRG